MDLHLGISFSLWVTIVITIIVTIVITIKTLNHGEKIGFLGFVFILLILIFTFIPLFFIFYPIINFIFKYFNTSDIQNMIKQELGKGLIPLRINSITASALCIWYFYKTRKHNNFSQYFIISFTILFYLLNCCLLWIEYVNGRHTNLMSIMAWCIFNIIDDVRVIYGYLRILEGRILKSDFKRVIFFNIFISILGIIISIRSNNLYEIIIYNILLLFIWGSKIFIVNLGKNDNRQSRELIHTDRLIVVAELEKKSMKSYD